jgi:hypothetical protein
MIHMTFKKEKELHDSSLLGDLRLLRKIKAIQSLSLSQELGSDSKPGSAAGMEGAPDLSSRRQTQSQHCGEKGTFQRLPPK